MRISFLGNDIETKFDIGDKAYRAGVVVLDKLCPKCKGNGYYRKSMDSDELETCEHCDGNGTLTVYKRTVNDAPLTVKGLNLNIDEESVNVSYSIEQHTPSGMIMGLSYLRENELFKTLKEMEEFCIEHNTTKKTIALKDIIIPDHYLTTYPKAEKISARMKELKAYGKFTNMIEVDINNVLVDGYTTYVLAKGFSFDEIEVIVREGICV